MSTNRPEITAEWTVHAQLTISRAGVESKSTTSQQSTESDYHKTPNEQEEINRSSGKSKSVPNPVTVVYKWSSTDDRNNEPTPNLDQSGIHSNRSSFKKGRNLFLRDETSDKPKNNSFNSTGGGIPPSDSGFSTTTNTSRKQSPFNSRCKSTCSIVLSACTDFYPFPGDEEVANTVDTPFSCNTTTRYTLTPEKTTTPQYDDDGHPTPEISRNVNFLSVKDAFSQTSDTELKSKLNFNEHILKKRRIYDYRRNTDSLLSVSPTPPQQSSSVAHEEGTKLSPFRRLSRSPQQHRPYSRSPSSPANSTNPPKKPPRTVHIDVYCTGSEAENEEYNDTDSTNSSDGNNFDNESNETPQTVFNSNQMRLHHSRITSKNELPRRIAHQLLDKQRFSSPSKLRQFLLDNSTSKNEVNESKQLLFDRHIGENQRPAYQSSRNRFNYRKDPSDDALSSNYPNSSRSTCRDITCSSISSALASSSVLNDDLESSWKESDFNGRNSAVSSNLAPSDSFEYENAADRARINQMEQLWSQSTKGWRSPEKERKFLMQQRRMIEFMHQNERQMKEKSNEVDDDSEDGGSVNIVSVSETDTDHLMYAKPIPTYSQQSSTDLNVSFVKSKSKSPIPERHRKIIFSPGFLQTTDITTVANVNNQNSSLLQNDHWHRARKFGAIVGGLRRTADRHFGPAKNPDCQCDHCRRWIMEREQGRGRGRTLSVGDKPISRSSFWLSRKQV